MDLRRDALVGAADVIRIVEELAREHPPEKGYRAGLALSR